MTKSKATPDNDGSAPSRTPANRKREVDRTDWRPRALKTKLPAYEQVANQLRDAIFGGNLRVGEVLPGENDLAAQFGVSRGTVREALRVLASQGFILTTRGVKGGSVVSHPSTEEIQQYIGATISLHMDTGGASIDMIVEARELIEVPAAGLAAQHRRGFTDEPLKAEVAMQKPDHPTILRSNRDFHIMLVRATGNPLLEIMLRPFLSVLHAYLPSTAPTSVYDEIDREHASIAEAVNAGDVEGAKAEMQHHLHTLRDVYGNLIPD